MGITLGIDGSRNRSGGARAHLIGILNDSDPREQGIDEIHVWSYKNLLDELPNKPWLIKHNPIELEKSLFHQIWWQLRSLPKALKQSGCDILLNTDAGTFSYYKPCVVMSRDMLSYEPGVMEKYGISFARLRLLLLKYVQSGSLKRANGSIFLTQYAKSVIENYTGKLRNSVVIPHGIGEKFRLISEKCIWPAPGEEIQCVYVSNFDLYKHQDVVVESIINLRLKGFNISLTLIGGGGHAEAERKVRKLVQRNDPLNEYISIKGHVPHQEIPHLMRRMNIFIFASSCENMPNTLIEGMCSGLPIVCSDRGPMPEVLKDGGLYFNPENANSLEVALAEVINNNEKRDYIKQKAKTLSLDYSWKRCAHATWNFLVEINSKVRSFE